MDLLSSILAFVLTYLGLGRKVGIPLGFILGLDSNLILALSLTLDFIQIPVFMWGYEQIIKFANKFRFLKFREGKLFGKFRKYGLIGVFLLAYVPIQGGGVWSACLLSRILKIDRRFSILAVALGSALSCITIYLLCLGIIEWTWFH